MFPEGICPLWGHRTSRLHRVPSMPKVPLRQAGCRCARDIGTPGYAHGQAAPGLPRGEKGPWALGERAAPCLGQPPCRAALHLPCSPDPIPPVAPLHVPAPIPGRCSTRSSCDTGGAFAFCPPPYAFLPLFHLMLVLRAAGSPVAHLGFARSHLSHLLAPTSGTRCPPFSLWKKQGAAAPHPPSRHQTPLRHPDAGFSKAVPSP